MRLAIGTLFIALTILFSLWRGGAPERLFALILMSMYGIDRIGHLIIAVGAQAALDALPLAIDSSAMIAIVAVMVLARRFWPICAASFQMLSLASHVVRLTDQGLPPLASAILGIAPSYLVCLTVLVGTICHTHRMRTKGSDPAWRSS